MANQFDFQVGAFFRLLNPGHGFAHKFYRLPPLQTSQIYQRDPSLLNAVPSSEAACLKKRHKHITNLNDKIDYKLIVFAFFLKVHVDLQGTYQILELYESQKWTAVSFRVWDRQNRQQTLWTNARASTVDTGPTSYSAEIDLPAQPLL